MTATSALASFGLSTKPAQEAMLNYWSPQRLQVHCLHSSGPLGSAGGRALSDAVFAYLIQLQVEFTIQMPALSATLQRPCNIGSSH
jgi:hypothetical protein